MRFKAREESTMSNAAKELKDKISMSFDEYMQFVNTCEAVEENYHDTSCDAKLKFTNRDHWPTVEELEAHNSAAHFSEMLPYLIYLAEVFIPKQEDKEKFEETRRYINALFKERLLIVDDTAN